MNHAGHFRKRTTSPRCYHAKKTKEMDSPLILFNNLEDVQNFQVTSITVYMKAGGSPKWVHLLMLVQDH